MSLLALNRMSGKRERRNQDGKKAATCFDRGLHSLLFFLLILFRMSLRRLSIVLLLLRRRRSVLWRRFLSRWRRCGVLLRRFWPHRRWRRRGMLRRRLKLLLWRRRRFLPHSRRRRCVLLLRLNLLRWHRCCVLLRRLLLLIRRPWRRHFVAIRRRPIVLRLLVGRLRTGLYLVLTMRNCARWRWRSRDRSGVKRLIRGRRPIGIHTRRSRADRLIRCLRTRLNLLLPLRNCARGC
jgi:hypothetical protein